MMTFKQLAIGASFEFANSPSGAERGPWRKISARRYDKTSPRAMVCTVGTVNVAVVPLTVTRPDDQLVTAIARTFVDLLRTELSAADWLEMRRRNATPEYSTRGCCASHDFTDANMVMAEACAQYGVRVRPSDDADDGVALWNAAWAAVAALQAEHEDDDPHCTCNDCMAAYAARLDDAGSTD